MTRTKTGLTDLERGIRDLWWQGKSLNEIASTLGITRNHVGVRMAKMRRFGVPLPYRRRAYADVPFGFGTWDERLAEMDRRRVGRRQGLYRSPYLRTLKADPCSYCGGPGGTLDHVTAWISGGTDDAENLVGACGRCNTSKHADSPLYFLLRRRILAELDLIRRPRKGRSAA